VFDSIKNVQFFWPPFLVFGLIFSNGVEKLTGNRIAKWFLPPLPA
jgi:hypothetical protein